MTAAGIEFAKLEALGNDFVLIDARDGRPAPEPDLVRLLADRRTGIGFDQLLALQPARSGALAGVRIINADGSAAEQCGNGMRAIAAWLDRRGELNAPARLQTPAGEVGIRRAGDGRYCAVLPGPQPLTPETLGLPPPQLSEGWHAWQLLSLGNPHLVVWCDRSPDAAALNELVRALDRQADWSGRVNIGLAQAGDGELILRVHERGAGPTPACGSGACAAAAAASRPAGQAVHVRQPGGTLVIDLDSQPGLAVTTGPARLVFEGRTA